MSNDSESKSLEEGAEGAQEPTGEKATVPPPAMYGAAVSEGDAEEATLLAMIPAELIESIRESEGDRPSVGGLKQMFSREPVPVRPLSNEPESDALLDMLFDEPPADPDDGVVTSAPLLRGKPGARVPPPPLPARPAIPPRSPKPSEEMAELAS